MTKAAGHRRVGARRKTTKALRVEVRQPGEAWRVASEPAGLTLAYSSARALVGETNESTDISGDRVVVRRWFFVRVVRLGHTLWLWRNGELSHEDDATPAGQDGQRQTCGEGTREGVRA